MASVPIEPRLARALVLDELFDLSLYQALREVAPDGPLRSVLDGLIPIERRHVAFWQEFFGLSLTRIGVRRRIELALLVGVCRVFGAPAIHLVLEAIEVYGVRKYLKVWEIAQGTDLEPGLRGILRDELVHEDAVVASDEERRIHINPERVRNIFLGLNDGLVEILGAVSGFFGAFGDPGTVLIAGTTTAVAGALSMAAGGFVATSSESEVRATDLARRRFLGEPDAQDPAESAVGAGALVGVSYLAGALVPMLPIAFGAHTALPSVVGAAVVIVAVSTILAFLSGMNIRRRVRTNLVVIAAAAAISYGIGIATKVAFGIAT